MHSISVAEARAIDRRAVEQLGMPSILLMENAARGVADAARELGDRFVVLCGPGNNGGDGLAAARHLGARARPHLWQEPDPTRSPDAALQLRILRAAGREIVTGAPPDPRTDPGAVWIDAMFGTGLTRGDTLLHEIGHAMGLSHSGASEQMMYAYLTRTAARFGRGDLHGLEARGSKLGCVRATSARATTRTLTPRVSALRVAP